MQGHTGFTANSLNTQCLQRGTSDPLGAAAPTSACRESSTEQRTTTMGFAAAQCSGDHSRDVEAHQGAGHGPKGTTRNSPAGPRDVLITSVQQGRGRAMLQYQESRSLLLTALHTPALMTLSRASPLTIGLRKILFFPGLFPKILPSLPQALCTKSSYSQRCLVESLTNHAQHLWRVRCSCYLTESRKGTLRLTEWG